MKGVEYEGMDRQYSKGDTVIVWPQNDGRGKAWLGLIQDVQEGQSAPVYLVKPSTHNFGRKPKTELVAASEIFAVVRCTNKRALEKKTCITCGRCTPEVKRGNSTTGAHLSQSGANECPLYAWFFRNFPYLLPFFHTMLFVGQTTQPPALADCWVPKVEKTQEATEC